MMTTYNFDTIIDRRSTDSIKWNMYPSDVLPLWVADMDFPSPEGVMQAVQERVEQGVFGYAIDSPPLREIIVERMALLYGWTIKADEIVFLPGLVSALGLVCKTFAQPGDNILVQTPVYPPFLQSPLKFDQTPNPVPLTLTHQPDGTLRYEIDFDAFEAAINPQTSIFLLCNPHNPVGRVFSPDELTRLAEICLKHNVLICSDEIHCDLMMDGNRHTPTASLSPEISARTITLMAPSKTFNIAGLGCAFAIVQDAELRQKLFGALFGLLPFPNVLGFAAALGAYRDGQAWLDALLPYLQTNRDAISDYVAEHLPGIRVTRPEATFLSWLDCREVEIDDPYKFFLDNARIAFSDGKTFGQPGEGFVRLNFGSPRAVVLQGLDQMRDALTAHRTR